MSPTKTIFTSKTMLVNGLIVAASFVPSVRDWMQAHPDTTMQIVAGANIALRWITKGRVTLFGSDS
jgi:hypothetical protein